MEISDNHEKYAARYLRNLAVSVDLLATIIYEPLQPVGDAGVFVLKQMGEGVSAIQA